MKAPRLRSIRLSRRAFTLPELMMVLTIIAVLLAVSISGYQSYRAKAETVDTLNKLKGMYAALSSYVVANGTWPQEPDDDESTASDASLWKWWAKELKEYGIHEADWFTSAHLRRLNNELKESGGKPVDVETLKEAMDFPSIQPTSFDPGPTEPYRYNNQPWVSETGEYHGDEGIYTVMPDGKIHKMMTMGQMNSARGKTPDSKKK